MSEENREKCAWCLNPLFYFTNHPDCWRHVQEKESVIDEAERRGAEKGFREGQKQMRERAEKLLKRGHDSECRCLPCGEVNAIRALPLEGPKDGRE